VSALLGALIELERRLGTACGAGYSLARTPRSALSAVGGAMGLQWMAGARAPWPAYVRTGSRRPATTSRPTSTPPWRDAASAQPFARTCLLLLPRPWSRDISAIPEHGTRRHCMHREALCHRRCALHVLRAVVAKGPCNTPVRSMGPSLVRPPPKWASNLELPTHTPVRSWF